MKSRINPAALPLAAKSPLPAGPAPGFWARWR